MDEGEYRERMARDLARWRSERLITVQQEHAILAREGAGAGRAVNALRLGWLVTAVSIIGALVLGGGIVLLFAANWEEMADWFRTAVVFAGVAAAYAIGYALIYRYDQQRIGSAFFLLGYVLYVAGIFLLAQIYNMPNLPELWLLAAAGGFALAYAFESRIVLLISIGFSLAFVFSSIFERYPDPPESAATLIVIGAFGVAVYAIGRLHALRGELDRYGDVYIFAGLLMLVGLIYAFTFDEIWDEIIDADVESYAAPTVVYVSLAIAAAFTAAQWWLRARRIEEHIEGALLIAILAVAAVVATWPAWAGYAILFNALFFAVALGLVARGYVHGDERYVNLGLALVAAGLVTRYIDVFWSLLAGSAFFIIGGVLLIGAAFLLERIRRNVLAAMEPGDDARGSARGGEAPA